MLPAGMRTPTPALGAVGTAGAAGVRRLLQAPSRLSWLQRGAALAALTLVAWAPLVVAAYPAYAAAASDVWPVTFPPRA